MGNFEMSKPSFEQKRIEELTEKLEQKTRDCENWSKMHCELLELSVNQKTTIDELREDLKSLELTKQTRLMKQTAVEWFYQRILSKDIKSIFKQAKEMEKEQLCKMYVQGRKDNHLDYYPEKHARETYNEFFKQD